MEHKGTYRVSRELVKSARAKALEQDLSLSEAIRQLLSLWVAGEIELPSREEKEPEEK